MTREGAGAEERAEMLHALCDCDGKHIYSDCPMLCELDLMLRAAEAAATAKERERIGAVLREIDSSNSHFGPGPHCTCSQGKRENIVREALRGDEQDGVPQGGKA